MKHGYNDTDMIHSFTVTKAEYDRLIKGETLLNISASKEWDKAKFKLSFEGKRVDSFVPVKSIYFAVGIDYDESTHIGNSAGTATIGTFDTLLQAINEYGNLVERNAVNNRSRKLCHLPPQHRQYFIDIWEDDDVIGRFEFT